MSLNNIRFVLLAFLFIIKAPVKAQVITPANASTPAATEILPVPAANNSAAKINYVRTWQPWKPIQDATLVPQQPVTDVKESTAYVDGLSRVVQTVTKGATPSGKDMVTYKVHDEYGRESLQYLPYASEANDGYFKTNPFLEQNNYYATPSKNNNQYIGEQVYYGRTAFEKSPLARPDMVLAAGNAWGGSNRGVRYKYLHNAFGENVRIWDVAENPGSTPQSNAAYPSGSLYKMVTIDEHNKQVIEYKDKEGKVVLKKVQIDDNPSAAHSGWLCTYYIYDNYGQLRCVIQPEGVKTLDGNWILTTTLLGEQCFRYEYDQRNRMVIKKVPGAGEVWMVYDARDRLVLTQDANLRAQGKWLYTTYDEVDRPLSSGFLTSAADRLTHQAAAANSIGYPNLAGQTYDELSRTYYDDYNWTVVKAFDNSDIGKLSPGSNPHAETVQKTELVQGAVTGNKTKVLGSNTYLITTIYYDEKGRVIQVLSDNVAGGTDITSTMYDFSGKVLSSYLRHSNPTSTATPVARLLTKYEYDAAGRLLKTWKQLNDNGSDKLVSGQAYDELGQLKEKKLGTNPSSGNTPLETLAYEYNIRGWLKSINKDFVNNGNAGGFFGQSLSYDHGFTNTQHNGNIAGMQWRSRGDGEARAYGFEYDAANRILKGDFTQYTGGAWNTNAGLDFSMGGPTNGKMEYDANGNIKYMQQKGWKVGGSTMIDDMIYHYFPGTNKLLAVEERTAGTTDHKLGDFIDRNTTIDDYDYDGNGNLTQDKNKSINAGGITYNHLNLPGIITVAGKGTIQYVYDATGNKLKKIADEANATVTLNGANYTTNITATTLYLGGIVYESKTYTNPSLSSLNITDRLQFISHEERRIRYKPEVGSIPASFEWDYFIKDHLGNVRMVLTEEQKAESSSVTSEDAALSSEQAVFENVNVSRTPKPISSGEKAQLLRKNGTAVGAAKLLKVMAGDRIHARVDYYTPNEGTDNSGADGLATVLTSLLNLLNTSSAAGAFHGYGSTVTNSLNNDNSFTSFFTSQGSASVSTDPKAYLNIVFFDEQMKFVQDGSESVQITSKGAWTQLQRMFANAKEAKKNGYVYVYLSNESNNLVYFDDLLVSHERGRILEETHFYPFGLTMAGISSKAAGGVGNRKGYNGNEIQNKEFIDGSGLEVYDFNARIYDQQLGRFMQIDPQSEEGDQESWSPYHFGYNNPVYFSDPDGKIPVPLIVGAIWAYRAYRAYRAVKTVHSTVRTVQAMTKNEVPHASRLVEEGTKALRRNFEVQTLQTGDKAQKVGDQIGALADEKKQERPVELVIDANKHPESAHHGQEAEENGIKTEGIIDRKGAAQRRRENLKGKETEPGKDRDEFPPAVIKTDGKVSVKSISSSDNRGAGASIGHQIRNLPDNTRVIIRIWPKK